MKTLKTLLLVALFMLSGLASAQTQQINVMFLFTKGAVDYMSTVGNGQSILSVANDMVSDTNALYATSGANARINNVGVINGQWCCDGHTALMTMPTLNPPIPGALGFAANDLRTALFRDATGADIVVLVGDFDRGNINPPNDVAGQSMSSGGQCSTTAKKPEAAFVGINIHHQLFLTHRSLLAHELGHQLCMQTPHAGWHRKTGTTPQNCEVRWSLEYGGGGYDSNFGGTTTACWKSIYAAGCFSTGHNAIVPATQGRGSCSWSNGTSHSASGANWWTEDVACSVGSPTSLLSTRQDDTTTGGFTCTNAEQIPYFAGATLPSQYAGGTIEVNTVAAMNAQAGLTAQFHNTKLTPRILRRIVGALLPF